MMSVTCVATAKILMAMRILCIISYTMYHCLSTYSAYIYIYTDNDHEIGGEHSTNKTNETSETVGEHNINKTNERNCEIFIGLAVVFIVISVIATTISVILSWKLCSQKGNNGNF